MADLRPDRVFLAAARALTDPRMIGVVQALPRTVAVVNRTRVRGDRPGQPATPFSVALAAQIWLDEVLISVMRDPKLFPRGDSDYEAAGNDISAAHQLWEQRGWLDAPRSYHLDPPPPDSVAIRRERAWEQRFEHLRFESGYAPHEGEPGRDGWLAQDANRTAHAYVMRHGEPGRPWMICLHGFGMGQPALDVRAFRAGHLHWELGLNVALVVLPVHGPRQAPGRRRGEGFMSIALMDSIHGLAQAAWDARRVISWIRATCGDVPIGVYGVSLGGYVSSLVASLEDGLKCVISGIPVCDIPELCLRHSPSGVRRRALAAGALGPVAEEVYSVVSPLAMEPLVEPDGRFIFAGVGDRMSTARQARRLWEHWGRPSIEWYPGGHIGFFMSPAVERFVSHALQVTGLVEAGAVPVPGIPPPSGSALLDAG